MYETYLEHHGILGQKWGIRRYQNEDGTLTNLGRKRVSSKYQNIDGSLNERGIDHRFKFADKKIAKNNKYYDRQIKKYNKRLEKETDEDQKDAIKSRIDNAERTRKQVNEYIKNMDIENIVSIENEAKQKAINIASATLGVAGAAGLGVAIPRYAAKGVAATANFLSTVDPSQTIESIYAMADTPQGKKAINFVDTGLRAYADVRAYVVSTVADQAIKRMEQQGTFDQIANAAGKITSQTGASVRNSMQNELDLLLKHYR